MVVVVLGLMCTSLLSDSSEGENEEAESEARVDAVDDRYRILTVVVVVQ